MKKLIVDRKNEFDLEVVLRGLQGCQQADGTILLDDYLFAFKELCRYRIKYGNFPTSSLAFLCRTTCVLILFTFIFLCNFCLVCSV